MQSARAGMSKCVARLLEESSHKTKVYSTDNMLYVKLAWEDTDQSSGGGMACSGPSFLGLSFLTISKSHQYMVKSQKVGL